jgi:hypothetical protein
LREFTFVPYSTALVNPEKQGNLGYQSSGGFCVEEMFPLSAAQQKAYSPAYVIHPSGVKLDKKDLLSKSGSVTLHKNSLLTRCSRSILQNHCHSCWIYFPNHSLSI